MGLAARLLVTWLTTVTLVGLCALVRADGPILSGLSLSLVTNSNAIDEGGTLKISGIVKNHSRSPVQFYRRPRAYAIYHVKVADRHGTDLRAFATAFVTPAPPTENDFVNLEPNATTVLTFTARFLHQTITNRTQPSTPIPGLFLDFDDSVIVIPAQGKYELWLEIEQPKEVIELLAAQFGVPNPWYGILTSGRRTIILR
jgi:hypothetical protein